MPAVILVVFWLALVVGIVWGWISNVINIMSYETLEMTGLLIVQIIGVFLVPLGALMGWIV